MRTTPIIDERHALAEEGLSGGIGGKSERVDHDWAQSRCPCRWPAKKRVFDFLRRCAFFRAVRSAAAQWFALIGIAFASRLLTVVGGQSELR